MNLSTILPAVILDIVSLASVIVLYLICASLNKRYKNALLDLAALEKERNDKKIDKKNYINQLCKDLNRVSETILTKLPKAIDSYKLSLEMKKAIIMYLAYFREYDEEYHWDITKVKSFTQETTIAREAKILLNHIKEGSYEDEKDRVLQAIAYLLLKS